MARISTFRGLAVLPWALALPLSLLTVGCGSTGAGPDAAGFATCATDTRAAPYTPGMSVTSLSGTFTVKLMKSTPGPPVKGNNSWVIEIDDALSGAPLDGVDLVISPFMPDHGHTSPMPVVTVVGPGTYSLYPVYLFMPGVWEVRMDIDSAGSSGGATAASDRAILPICIP